MNRRHLSLVRHAQASRRFRNLDDFRRPLNGRGLRECAMMPRVLARKLPAPNLILSSDAVRAVQTCQALADAYDVFDDRIVLDPSLYRGNLRMLLSRVRRVRDAVGHVMVIGHHPGLTELCNYLLPKPLHDLSTMSVAVLRLECSSWSAAARGKAQLLKVFKPRDMLKGRL